MYSKAKRVVKSRIGRRFLLVLLGTVIFSLLIFLVCAYSIMSASLFKEEQKFLVEEASEISLRFLQSKFNTLERLDTSLVVQIRDVNGQVIFERLPVDGSTPEPKIVEEGLDTIALSDGFVFLNLKNTSINLSVYARDLRDHYRLIIGRSDQDRESHLRQLLIVFLWLLIPVVLIAAFAGFFLVDRSLYTIRSVVSTLAEIQEGNISSRIPSARANDEMGDLIALFNRLLDRIERLIDGIHKTVDQVAHDLRTPITRFRIRAEQAIASANERDDRDHLLSALQDCLEASESILQFADQVLEISMAEAGEMPLNLQAFGLESVVTSAISIYEFSAEEKNIELTYQIERPILVMGDEPKLLRVLCNLIDNAIKYTPVGGHVRISAKNENKKIFISVQDTGTGIPLEERPRIWTKLFRGSQHQRLPGLGLGLSWVKAVIEAHRGSIILEKTSEQGTTFTIQL